ncbi:MAG: ATP-dependent 6-phosphofructokinase [Nitrospinota bacterium]
MKRIAVLSSGGDAPGMNPAIRAITKASLSRYGLLVYGIKGGFAGLAELAELVERVGAERVRQEMQSKMGLMGLTDDDLPIFRLTYRAVHGIARQGGTILGSARFPEFRKASLRRRVGEALKEVGIEGLIVMGGDGSLRGAQALSREMGIPAVGLPASIDNDIAATDMSIGVDTARNTAVNAINMIMDTADSLHRTFVVEVMGNRCGDLALMSALATGADALIIPEQGPLAESDLERIGEHLRQGYLRGKKRGIVVVAEGARMKGRDGERATVALGRSLQQKAKLFDPRVVILAHIQRGGSPTAFDRILAARMSDVAVKKLSTMKPKDKAVVVLLKNNVIVTQPLEKALLRSSDRVIQFRKRISQLYELFQCLSE